MPIPVTYVVERVIEDMGPQAGFLREPDDLFIDNSDILYVADRGNDRIVKLDLHGRALNVFTAEDTGGLNNPRGVYVHSDGDLFIADTGNERILHLSPNGDFVEEFTAPETKLLGETFTFDPMKIYINNTGIMHVLKSQAFLTMDARNAFRGLVGASHLDFNLGAWIVSSFATGEQKDRLAKRQPPPYSNFVIDANGMIYAAVVKKEEDQIRKINSVGENIYPSGIFYGERIIDEFGVVQLPHFVDIAVDPLGVIYVLEQRSGKIYQYDQEGNNLTVFGGIGDLKGMFSLPTSLEIDSKGYLYVLDANLKNITVFKPTRFIQVVHRAVDFYSRGEYEEALEVWREVLSICSNYALAHKGIGKALLKADQYETSMTAYLKADDQDGYTAAFEEHRHGLFRKYFFLVVLVFAVAIFGLSWAITRLRRRAAAAADNLYHEWQGE
ncbi:MAG: tetratricopeptide repeat protein [Spirochaetales bacterium]|nr:tetratricopeptide repeat protein [Spirochaetales bacterium]